MPQQEQSDPVVNSLTELPGGQKKPRSKRRLFLKWGVAIVAVVLLLFGAYYFLPKNFGTQRPTNYSQAWRLVGEKISKSAPIRVYVPEGMTVQQVIENTAFDPEIPGHWVEQKSGFFDVIGVAYGSDTQSSYSYAEYQPDQPLSEGLHYSVSLKLADGNILKADFLSAEDPKIDAIFPKSDMEAPEDSKISIVFNRPMVALSTADMMEPAGLPIEVVPSTDGKWKWTSTNMLQFIPAGTLKLSSNYRIKINAGLKSIDGLDVTGTEVTFRTRNLRYLEDASLAISDTVYNQPRRIYFNQPVDLEKTSGKIKVFDITDNKEVDFIAEYKKIEKQPSETVQKATNGFLGMDFGPALSFLSNLRASLFNSNSSNDFDRSVIEVYGKKDEFGRSKFWDTGHNYRIEIDNAYPAEGDINAPRREFGFLTTNLVSSWSETGGRSDYNDISMFDPEGKLKIVFYEDINLAASNFSATVPVTNKEYGKKCDDPNLSVEDSNCVQVDDTKAVLLTFDKNRVKAGDVIGVSIEKLVGASNTKINGETIKQDLSVYKPLEYRVATKNNAVDLNYLTLCSNNPLAIPERQDFGKKISADKEFEIFSWGRSFERTWESDSLSPTCNVGEFETDINVGLIPDSNYEFSLNATDLFGQSLTTGSLVATGPMQGSMVNLFGMQQETSVTTPGESVLTYGAKNLTYVDVSVCKLTAFDFYRQQQRLNDWRQAQVNPFPQNCIQTVKKRVELPQRYWLNNYFDVEITAGFAQQLGNYIVTLENPLFKFYDGSRRYVSSYLTVTKMAAAQKSVRVADYLSDEEFGLTSEQIDSLKNIYWVTDIKTLAPVAGATVTLYSGNKNVGQGLTDASGVAAMKPVEGADLAVVEYGGDSTVIGGYETQMNWASAAYNVRRAYIYTDRPIYRPGDKVNIKGVLRLGYDGNYQMWDQSEAQIEIRGPQYDIVATPTAKINEFGAWNSEYALDAEVPLGNYQVCIKGSYDCGSFSVKEYAPAAFQVAATTAKEEYVSKDKIKVDIEAKYYFGVPVENADVEYTISSQNYYFDKYKGGGYNFGFFEECDRGYCYGDKFIGRGTLKLDANGKGSINEAIDLQKIAGDGGFANSRIIVFDITAKNSMGQSISAQKSVILHAGGVYIGASADPSFAPKDQQIKIAAIAVDNQGNPSEAKNVTAAVYKADWIYAKRQEAGGYYNYDWTKKRVLVSTINLDSKGNGRYEGSIKLSETGEYEIDISGEDKQGNKVMSRDYVYVYGGGAASIRLYDGSDLTLKSETDELEAGKTGSLIIESPFDKAKALVSIERGKVFKYEIIDINGSLQEYSFDVSDEYAPNVFVSVLLQSSKPAVKFGSKEFKVNSGAHKLNIDVSSDKKTYKPGEKVVLNLHASDSNGRPVKADISVAVADLSVLALAGNPKKDPMIFFYDGFPLTVSTSSSMKEVLVKVDRNSLTKGGSGGGAESEDNVRGEFRDTAFWQGSAVTDTAGNARIEFSLPDNLTTWQTEAVGVTQDTKVGAGYAEFMSRNDLMVVPVKPRFIVPGDEFLVAAQVFNQSDSARKIKIGFASDTLEFTGGNKNIESNINSGDSKTVYFKVRAPLDQTKGIHTFTISADGEGISDAVRQSIPVQPNLTYEATATANYVTGDRAAEVIYLPANVSKDQGGLTIRTSATLAVFLSQALNYFIEYPYGCTEQISSRLKAMAAVKGGLDVPNLADKFQLKKVWVGESQYSIDDLIDIGLNRVYSNQTAQGGFGLWDSREPDYYATMEAVEMLEALKDAGIAINQSSLDRALSYLGSEFSYNTRNMGPDSMIAAAAVLLKDGYGSSNYSSAARAAIINLLSTGKRNSVLNDQLSNRSLLLLSIILSGQDFAGALKDVNAVLDNRITIDSRGAFLQTNLVSGGYDPYSNTIGNTALYLKSLAAGRRDTVYTDKVVRWLLSSRDKDGAWGSTQNTLATVTAFTDFLKWKKETEADFTLAVDLNGKQLSEKKFDSSTILDQSVAEVDATSFETGKNNVIAFTKKDDKAGNGFYYDMGLKYYLSGLAAPRDEGFAVSRAFYALGDESGKTPLESANSGDVLRAHIEITVGRDRRNVAIEDFIPAGMEIVDMELATEQKSLSFNEPQVSYNLLNPDYKELRDERAFMYISYLNAGTYEFDYYVRALAKGDYLQLPCVASEFYNPENFGRSDSRYFTIK